MFSAKISEQFRHARAPILSSKGSWYTLRDIESETNTWIQIFHTGSGPLSGIEDRFPGPDNPSKMRRSIENAEHVG